MKVFEVQLYRNERWTTLVTEKGKPVRMVDRESADYMLRIVKLTMKAFKSFAKKAAIKEVEI